jgi:hypothetical protein
MPSLSTSISRSKSLSSRFVSAAPKRFKASVPLWVTDDCEIGNVYLGSADFCGTSLG